MESHHLQNEQLLWLGPKAGALAANKEICRIGKLWKQLLQVRNH